MEENNKVEEEIEEIAGHKNDCSALLNPGDWCSHFCNHDENVIRIEHLINQAKQTAYQDGLRDAFTLCDEITRTVARLANAQIRCDDEEIQKEVSTLNQLGGKRNQLEAKPKQKEENK